MGRNLFRWTPWAGYALLLAAMWTILWSSSQTKRNRRAWWVLLIHTKALKNYAVRCMVTIMVYRLILTRWLRNPMDPILCRGGMNLCIPEDHSQIFLWQDLWLCRRTSHREYFKRKLPLCYADVSGSGTCQHRQNAPIHPWWDHWKVCGDEYRPSLPRW